MQVRFYAWATDPDRLDDSGVQLNLALLVFRTLIYQMNELPDSRSVPASLVVRVWIGRFMNIVSTTRRTVAQDATKGIALVAAIVAFEFSLRRVHPSLQLSALDK